MVKTITTVQNFVQGNVEFHTIESDMDGEIVDFYRQMHGGDEGYFQVINRDALIEYSNDYVKSIALKFITNKTN